MQLFVRSTAGRTLALELERDLPVRAVKECLEARDGVPANLQFLQFGGRVLEDDALLSDSNIPDGATLGAQMRLRGGAAAKAKAAAAEALKKAQRDEEYKTWHSISDLTDTTGVMRVLCVSMILNKDREEIQKADSPFSSLGDDGPAAEKYDEDDATKTTAPPNPQNWTWGPNGFPKQLDYDKAYEALMDEFVSDHWDCMKVKKEKESEGKRKYVHNGIASKNNADTDVEVICGEGFDGLWYKGPKKIVICDSGEEVWDLVTTATEKGLWCKEKDCFREPWKIDGQYKDIERWIYNGIGTTTYTVNAKGQMTLWSQETGHNFLLLGWLDERDETGPMALTDREKMRLRQMMQLSAKENKGKKLSPEENDLQKEVVKLVECSPSHRLGSGIFSWRIKSLKKLLSNKVVFWTNSEDRLPVGSVADKTNVNHYSGPDPDAIMKNGIQGNGSGNEVMEFWKYEKKIGALRKKYIMEDRQRFMDTIERFTPTYKAVIKNQGQDATDDGGDHYMTMDYQRKITNIVALALDMNFPDFEEDKIACFIKTLTEKRIGPTWHVLVGRSFGFSVQCEARHFLHIYMQHLAVVIWKSEPDPNAVKK